MLILQMFSVEGLVVLQVGRSIVMEHNDPSIQYTTNLRQWTNRYKQIGWHFNEPFGVIEEHLGAWIDLDQKVIL